MRVFLAQRSDSHDALFLTDKGVPYRRSRSQSGFQFKKGWKRTREGVVSELERRLEVARCAGEARRADELAQSIGLARQATGHWGRHSMISRAVLDGKTDRQVMALAGLRSPDMIARYAHLRGDTTRAHAEDVAVDLPIENMIPDVGKRRG
jgi:hypothetical protein